MSRVLTCCSYNYTDISYLWRKKFPRQEWVWPNIFKLLSESISGASNRFVISKNIGIDYPHATVTIKQPFHIFLKNSHGQKWAWPNIGQIMIWDKIDASNRFVMSKNMVIEYPHVMVTIKQRFHISLKNSHGQKWVWPKIGQMMIWE